MTINVSYTPDLRMHVKAYSAIQRITKSELKFIVFVVVVMIVVVQVLNLINDVQPSRLLGIMEARHWTKLAGTFVVGVAVMFVLTRIANYACIWLTLRGTPVARQRLDFKLSESGFEVSTDGVSTTFDWRKIVRVETDTAFLLLFSGNHRAYFVPMDVLDEGDAEQVLSWYQNSRP
ncbi:MAG: YcxB family protein [Pseudomonadota bacterium]